MAGEHCHGIALGRSEAGSRVAPPPEAIRLGDCTERCLRSEIATPSDIASSHCVTSFLISKMLQLGGANVPGEAR